VGLVRASRTRLRSRACLVLHTPNRPAGGLTVSGLVPAQVSSSASFLKRVACPANLLSATKQHRYPAPLLCTPKCSRSSAQYKVTSLFWPLDKLSDSVSSAPSAAMATGGNSSSSRASHSSHARRATADASSISQPPRDSSSGALTGRWCGRHLNSRSTLLSPNRDWLSYYTRARNTRTRILMLYVGHDIASE
jgi:hypothetical protein